MHCLHLNWLHLKEILSATAVGIEIAVVGAVIAMLQLVYAQKRDRAVDTRNAWTEIHKAMMEFRFRRELLNQPFGEPQIGSAIDAFSALYHLRGQLDRVESPLATEISNFLQGNWQAAQWRSAPFTEPFDKYAHEAARRCWPSTSPTSLVLWWKSGPD
jgi:hypothetical protein